MQIVQGNVLESLRGVQTFLDAHAGLFPVLVGSGTRARLDARVAELSSHVATQGNSHLTAKGATQKKYSLSKTLLNVHMAPIARIAAADLPHTPELAALKMPRGTPNVEVLYQAAMAMADIADQYAAVFIAAARPADFTAQLRATANAMLVPVDARTSSRGSRVGATKGVGAALLDARKTVRIIDSIVRPILADDAGLLASWDSVKRPPSKSGKAAVAPPAAPPMLAAPQAPALAATT